jgi:hypothetical protein
MKTTFKKFSLALLLFCVTIVAHAQFRWGIKAGVNVSDMSSTSNLIKEVNTICSWQAGAVFQYKIFDFSIQPEIVFSVLGGDLVNASPGSGPLTDMVGSGTLVPYRSQSIIVPLNFQYGRDFGKVHLYAQVGPSLNFLISGKLNGTTENWNTVQDTWGFNKVDLGFGIGVGAELKRLQLSLRYDFSGAEIGKEFELRSVNINPFNDMKEKKLSVSLGYFF